MMVLTHTIPLAMSLALAAPPSEAEQMQKALVSILVQQTEQTPGWPWEADGVRPSPNLGGVIALSLLELYERVPDPGTWVTLTQYGHSLRAYYAPAKQQPFKADIELLARLAKVGVDREGEAFARDLFERVRRVSPTGAAEYQRIARGRAKIPSVIGYDIALTIRAALAVDQRAYAAEIADAAIAAGHLELSERSDGTQVTSVGALLHALSRLNRSQDREAIANVAEALIRGQAAHGSWAQNNTQATAYAVQGLSTATHAKGAQEAALRGQEWLMARQLKSGAWAEYHDGLPEPFVGRVLPLVHAEAFAALLLPR